MTFINRLFFPYGMDLFCLHHKFLLYNLVSKSLKLKYRKSSLGFLWSLVAPASVTLVYYFVFQFIMKVRVDNYLVFLVSGIFPWQFFAQSIQSGMSSIVSNHAIISKVPIPLNSFCLSDVLSNGINLILAFPIIVAAAVLNQVSLGGSLLLIPYYVALLAVMAYSVGLVLSIAFVYFRDLAHLLPIAIQIWFYGTPLLYNADMIPDRIHWILYANPVAQIFVSLRAILHQGQWPTAAGVWVPLVWMVALLAMSVMLFARARTKLVENV